MNSAAPFIKKSMIFINLLLSTERMYYKFIFASWIRRILKKKQCEEFNEVIDR